MGCMALASFTHTHTCAHLDWSPPVGQKRVILRQSLKLLQPKAEECSTASGRLLGSALVDMAETNVMQEQTLSTSDPTCTDADADLLEPIYLLLSA